jgi:hypothetical protein
MCGYLMRCKDLGKRGAEKFERSAYAPYSGFISWRVIRRKTRFIEGTPPCRGKRRPPSTAVQSCERLSEPTEWSARGHSGFFRPPAAPLSATPDGEGAPETVSGFDSLARGLAAHLP